MDQVCHCQQASKESLQSLHLQAWRRMAHLLLLGRRLIFDLRELPRQKASTRLPKSDSSRLLMEVLEPKVQELVDLQLIL